MTCDECQHEYDNGYMAGNHDGYGAALQYEQLQTTKVVEILARRYEGELTDFDTCRLIKDVLYFYPEAGFPERWEPSPGSLF